MKVPAAKDLIGTWAQDPQKEFVDGKIQGQHVEITKGESQVLNVELVRK